MDVMLDFVVYGENIHGNMIGEIAMSAVLSKLEDQLRQRGYDWRDVSLLLLMNSKAVGERREQHDSDQALTDGLQRFCADREWFPPLVGCSVHSSFFRSQNARDEDIHDGILLTAVISAVFEKIPVAFEMSPRGASRKYTARHVIQRCVEQYRKQLEETYGVKSWGAQEVFGASTGILFTTGSGHVERYGTDREEFIDFSDCYALGQELIGAWDDARLIGGCASNRTPKTYQAVYYSFEMGPRTAYRTSYMHCAVVAFLPQMTPRFVLLHPFEYGRNATPLDIEWDHTDAYEEGRYFVIKSINGEAPVDFLARYWDVTRDELLAMETNRTPIPAEPKTYKYTIASSRGRTDQNFWPNVPVWFERVGDQVMLRLVRAEAEDGRSYLMVMGADDSHGHDALRENCRELALTFQNTTNKPATVISFICESRKYLLNRDGVNLEAESFMQLLPEYAQVIGIYINGEYSVGAKKSIGYHNFSQISAIAAERPASELPQFIIDGKLKNTKLKIFISHASRDKALIGQILAETNTTLKGLVRWVDEDQIPTGADLEREIRNAIGASDTAFLLAFISATSLNSQWVRSEIEWAIAEEAKRGNTYVLPVLLDDVWDELERTWPPGHVDYLRRHKYRQCHAYNTDAIEAFSKQLANDVKVLVGRRDAGAAPDVAPHYAPRQRTADHDPVLEPSPVGARAEHGTVKPSPYAPEVGTRSVATAASSAETESVGLPAVVRRRVGLAAALFAVAVATGLASWGLGTGPWDVAWQKAGAAALAVVSAVSLLDGLGVLFLSKSRASKDS